VAAAAPLLLAIRWTGLGWVAVLALATEISISGLVGQASHPPIIPTRPIPGSRVQPLDPLRSAAFQASAVTRPGPIAVALRSGDGGRYVSIDPEAWSRKGYHVHRDPATLGFMDFQQSMLFGLEEAQG